MMLAKCNPLVAFMLHCYFRGSIAACKLCKNPDFSSSSFALCNLPQSLFYGPAFVTMINVLCSQKRLHIYYIPCYYDVI